KDDKGRWIKSPDRPKKEGNSAVIFAKYLGLGHTIIGQVEYLKNHASPELLLKLRHNEISVSRAYDYLRGLNLIPKRTLRPKEPVKVCQNCKFDVVPKTKCHVHKWYCCTNCKWGL
ncbi:MAG: hypothetical protein ACKO7N_02325, partial [Candidatus Nitrosotenuis sp.]